MRAKAVDGSVFNPLGASGVTWHERCTSRASEAPGTPLPEVDAVIRAIARPCGSFRREAEHRFPAP